MNKENLNKLQMAYKIMNSTENNKEYSYKELSNLVGIDTNQTKMIYTLYSLQTTKLKITPINFVDFILQHKEAVSYTHLDVYKRQIYNISLFFYLSSTFY